MRGPYSHCLYPPATAAGAQDTHYTVLGVPVSASPGDVRRAYHLLALKLHPDKNNNDPQLSSQFRAVTAAYQILSDPSQRLAYDFRCGLSPTHTGNVASARPRTAAAATHRSQMPYAAASPRGEAPDTDAFAHFSQSTSGLRYAPAPRAGETTATEETSTAAATASSVPAPPPPQQQRPGTAATKRTPTVSGYTLSSDEVDQLNSLRRRHEAAERYQTTGRMHQRQGWGADGNVPAAASAPAPTCERPRASEDPAAPDPPPRKASHSGPQPCVSEPPSTSAARTGASSTWSRPQSAPVKRSVSPPTTTETSAKAPPRQEPPAPSESPVHSQPPLPRGSGFSVATTLARQQPATSTTTSTSDAQPPAGGLPPAFRRPTVVPAAPAAFVDVAPPAAAFGYGRSSSTISADLNGFLGGGGPPTAPVTPSTTPPSCTATAKGPRDADAMTQTIDTMPPDSLLAKRRAAEDATEALPSDNAIASMGHDEAKALVLMLERKLKVARQTLLLGVLGGAGGPVGKR